MEQKRLFLAIPIPDALQEELSGCRVHLPHPDLRWTPLTNLHITLVFIGGVAVTEVPLIGQKLSSIHIPPFTLRCTQIHGVTRKRVTSMIWAALEPHDSFTRLAEQISEVLAISLDHKPLPHITLARTSRNSRYRLGAESESIPPINHLQVQVTGFELWESKLGPGGSTYQSLQRFLLG